MDLHAGQRFMKRQLTRFALGADTPLRAGGIGRGILSARRRAVLGALPPSGRRCLSGFLRRFSQEKQNKRKENIISCKHVCVAFEWRVGGKRREVLSLPSMLVCWAFEVFHLAFCFLAQGADTPRVQGEESARVSSHDESLNWEEDLSLFHLQEDGFIFLRLKPFFCGNVTQLDFQRDIPHSEFKTHSEFRFFIIHNTNCTTLIILTSEKHFQPQLVNFMVQGIINVLQYTQRLPALQLGP